jgi:hypothetical protein
MTSFEPPDAVFLVEHLLPSLLDTSHGLSQDVRERTLFFGELGTSLEALRGRLTVITSPPRALRDDSPYPWLWRYVSHFIVGASANAVQHAKLWAFHWQVGDQQQLELHVSSTNLTTAAFKTQLQMGWHTRLSLGNRASQRARRTWKDLLPFLDALGASAGDIAAARLHRLVTLLARVECPADVTFVASVPGQKSSARRLRSLKPSELHVLAPTVGDWNPRTLEAWSADVGVAPRAIHLKWISERHPWAVSSGWTLTRAARRTLEDRGVRLDCLPASARLHEEHRDGDPRWCHGKMYVLRARRMRRLLVTSANWSIAAWGAGSVAPRNFELGVLLETGWSDLEAMDEPFAPPATVPFCVDRADDEGRISPLAWAEGRWDGQRIVLRARSIDRVTPIKAVVTFSSGMERAVSLSRGAATIKWSAPDCTPLSARFTQGGEALDVDVLDLRSPSQFARTPLPEVDPAVAQALRDAFLLQRYGGPAVARETIAALNGTVICAPDRPTAEYAVQAWLDARRAFQVVDQWRAALAAADDPVVRERVRFDGDELRALYDRSGAHGAPIVVEEIGWRLDEGT